MIFRKLTLLNGKLAHEYTKPYKILAEVIKRTNNSIVELNMKNDKRTFELEKKAIQRFKKNFYMLIVLLWLPLVDMFINREIELNLDFIILKNILKSNFIINI